jgi:hypothetical protein
MVVEYAAVHVRMVPTEESGRRTPVRLAGTLGDSYKPHFRIGLDGEFLGVAFVEGPERLAPGEEADATVVLLYASTGVDYTPLAPGVEFNVVEGPHVVARGTILRRWRAELA